MWNMPYSKAQSKARSVKILTTFNTITKDMPEKDFFFADSNWAGGKSMWQIKVSEANLDKFEQNIEKFDKDHEGVKTVSGKAVLDYVFGAVKIRFLASHKKSAKAADAKTTAMQERASAWIMKRAIKDSYRYDKWTDIKLDPKYKELEKIYPEVDEEWLQVFYAQQARMLEEFSNVKFKIFNRDEGFMGYISNIVKQKFGVSKKDTWNPADIWCIQDQNKIESIIDKTIDGNGSQTILELNAVLRKLFKDRKVVGISLKKVSGKTAKYEEYNVREDGLEADYNFNVDNMTIDLSTKSENEFSTQDTRIIVSGNGAEYNFQIKGNDSVKVSNLKWEPTQKGSAAARVGKAPVDMVGKLISDNKGNFINRHQNFPSTATKFLEEEDKYRSLFTKLKTKKVDTKIANEQTFVDNMLAVYANEPHVAHSKCMQMAFLDVVVGMKKEKRREFMTDMVFLAAKKGKRFGPFGKLY